MKYSKIAGEFSLNSSDKKDKKKKKKKRKKTTIMLSIAVGYLFTFAHPVSAETVPNNPEFVGPIVK